jgi:hypothetical protein
MRIFFWRGGYGRISGGTRVLEVAADSWEAALGHGARSQPPAMREFLSLPWGRGLKLRRTEAGRGRKSGTVWRRRALGSTAAGKPGTGDFRQIFSYPTSFVVRRLDPCVLPTPPLVGTRLSAGCLRYSVPRVIVTARCS